MPDTDKNASQTATKAEEKKAADLDPNFPTNSASPRPLDELKQKEEITNARIDQADRHDEIRQAAREGDPEASFEGARPEFEPLPGEAKGSIPDGLVVGGPVLSLEEQERIARQRGKEGSPVPQGKAVNQKTSNT